jgi:cell division septation protein DedD
MKFKFICICAIASLVFTAGCSSMQETTRETQKEPAKEKQTKGYVFDELPADSQKVKTTVVKNKIAKEKEPVFIVQIGAFNTEEKAREFEADAEKKIQRKISVSFSSSTNLFVVQLDAFKTKIEAENFRNDLWQSVEFKDAFIVTEEK